MTLVYGFHPYPLRQSMPNGGKGDAVQFSNISVKIPINGKFLNIWSHLLLSQILTSTKGQNFELEADEPSLTLKNYWPPARCFRAQPF